MWRPAAQGGWGPNLWVGARPFRWLTVGASASLVLAWADDGPPSPHPERSAADARAIFVEPRYRIVILGAQAIVHN